MEHQKGLCFFFYSFLSSIVERPVYIHSGQPETGMCGRAQTIYQGERKIGGRVYITLLVGMIEVAHIYMTIHTFLQMHHIMSYYIVKSEIQ